MAAITVTINTPASGPFQLSQLFGVRTNSYGAAVTVTGATGGSVYPHAPRKPDYLNIEADPTNAGTIVFTGDKNLTTSGNQGKKLSAGQNDTREKPGYLDEVFINASAAGAIVNIEATGGAA